MADPRPQSGWNGKGKYVVAPFDGPANTVIGGSVALDGGCAPDADIQDGRTDGRTWKGSPASSSTASGSGTGSTNKHAQSEEFDVVWNGSVK